MRALLLYNPSATTTTPAVIDVITHALAAHLKLDVEATKRRAHATLLSAGAVHGGYEVVVVVGGDGTVNEVLQGIAGTAVRLAIIPGGSANVWARSLGLPGDPVEATSIALRNLRERRSRTVNLGIANGRYFGFCAGWGYDGAVVRMVEERLLLKRTVRQATFLWCGLLAYLRTIRTDVRISLSVDGRCVDDALRTVVACNSDPYTFFGTWPARLCPRADLDAGLDLTGLTSLGFLKIARVARRALMGGTAGRLDHVREWHDHQSYELRATAAVAVQVDGEYIGETDHLVLQSVPRACTVVV
ncbi:MAG: diacylglycerol/lipid kinase family protein [Egibacteraceae bacterium]